MATKSTTKILQEARALILDPEHWIRGTMARTKRRGIAVPARDPRATCFCASGAIRRASGDAPYFRAEGVLLDAMRGTGVMSFNDRPGRISKIHAEVIAAFDAAIKLSKSRKKVLA